jgi:hypothetical protein
MEVVGFFFQNKKKKKKKIGSLGGRPDDILHALSILQEEGPRRGILLNPSKCEIVAHPAARDAALALQRRAGDEYGIIIPDDKLFLDGNYSLLGAPIGDPIFCAHFIRDHSLSAASASLRAAQRLRDPQVAFALLRRCAGFGQLVYSIRTTPPSAELGAICNNFDQDLLQTICHFIGHVQPSAVPQVRRATRTGGLGFRSASQHMCAAYVASVTTCALMDDWLPSDATGYDSAVAQVSAFTNTVIDASVARSQHKLSELIDAAARRAEQQQDTMNDLARKMSQSAPHATDWLLAIPSHDLNQAFTPREFVALVRWWLGQTVYDSAGPCPACDACSDQYGYHALTCPCWGGRIHRHHALANECARALTKAHHNPSREKSLDGTTRPCDVYVPHWEAGMPLALDFAVTHPLQPTAFSIAVEQTPGSWAAMYADLHKSKFEAPCAAKGVQFKPMVVDTFGAWDPAACTLLNAIADQYAIHQSVPPAYAANVLFTRLSVTLMRMNARMLLVRKTAGFAEEDPLRDDDPITHDDPDDLWDAPTTTGVDHECRF